MRAYDNTNNELYWKSIKPAEILTKTTMDLLNSFPRDTVLYFLRIAIIILAYIVLRPLIEACFRRFMPRQETEYELETEKENRQKRLADELLFGSEDEELEDILLTGDHRHSTSKDEWGGILRKRQKAKFMETWEKEQARLAEEEELRELNDILEH